MIVQVKNYQGHMEFTSDGCGCCSVTYGDPEFGPLNEERVIEHLKDNVRVTKEACDALGIDFETFISDNS